MWVFFLKTLGQPKVKRSLIILKFDTLLDWMNTFIFENLPFWALGTRFSYIFVYVLKLWGSLAKLKVA